MEADGFSLDDKRQRVAENDIPDIIEKWRVERNAIPSNNVRTGKCFLVPADEIRAHKYNLSISRYKQIEHKVASKRFPHEPGLR